MKNILLLGATGVLGREIQNLLLQKGMQVTAYSRHAPAVPDERVEHIIGDRRDTDAFSRCFAHRSFDAVIDMISYTAQDARSTLETFSDRTGQIIVASSVAAYARPYTCQPVREDNPLTESRIFPYGFQKAEMERYLHVEMEKGMPITVIRPSQTYGIGTPNVGCLRNNYGLVARILEEKPILVNGDGRNPWVWSFAPDLAKAFVGAIGKTQCLGQCYHATSDDTHIWDDLYLTLGELVGKKPTLYHIATDMLFCAKPELFGHLVYEKTYCGLFDNSKIKRDIPEFVCEYDLKRGMEMICRWWFDTPSQQVIDPEKVRFEDEMCAFYERCIGELSQWGK